MLRETPRKYSLTYLCTECSGYCTINTECIGYRTLNTGCSEYRVVYKVVYCISFCFGQAKKVTKLCKQNHGVH